MREFDTHNLNAAGLAVVVGGSGFIGRYLVQELARSGIRIRVAVRNAVAANFLQPLGALGQVEIVEADVTNAASLARAFRDATTGVNLVGILAEGGQKFDAVQNRGAAAVALAAAAAGVASFVQVSAIGADVTSPSRYGRSKGEGEAAVRAALPGATIIRPSIVFGAEDLFLNRFAALAQSLPVVPVVAGDTRFQPVYVLDVARAIVAALADPRRHGGHTYDLGGPRTYTFRALIAWIMREVRADKPMVDVPPFAAKLMAQLGSILPGMPMTHDQWLMLQSDNIAVLPGLAELGIEPTPMEAIAPLYLERFRTAGRFHRDRAA
ncbi:MAG: complex I NDUFA9 subunit family protein [Polymorphobacter sp.]